MTDKHTETHLFVQRLNHLLMDVRNRSIDKMNISLEENVTSDVPGRVGETAIWNGVVDSITIRAGYDKVAALALSANILEKCKAHDEAKILREIAKGILDNPNQP